MDKKLNEYEHILQVRIQDALAPSPSGSATPGQVPTQTEFDVILQLPISRKEIIVSNVKPGTILYFNLTTLSFAQQ